MCVSCWLSLSGDGVLRSLRSGGLNTCGGLCHGDGCSSGVKEGGANLCVIRRVGDKACHGSAGQVSGGFSGNGIHVVLQSVADGFQGGLNLIGSIGPV
jgi:hypothetical protein